MNIVSFFLYVLDFWTTLDLLQSYDSLPLGIIPT